MRSCYSDQYYLKKYSKYSYSWDIRECRRIIQKEWHYQIQLISVDTYSVTMGDPVGISVDTLRIYSGCSLEKEFTKLIHMNPLMVFIPNCQSGWFISWLCMWSFDLRHRRHLVDGWSCFDYDLRIRTHGISKTSYFT